MKAIWGGSQVQGALRSTRASPQGFACLADIFSINSYSLDTFPGATMTLRAGDALWQAGCSHSLHPHGAGAGGGLHPQLPSWLDKDLLSSTIRLE